ncbi:hypothetical protein [Bifidobacterium bombi]|uniref:Uncharacterized protein n=1 Tax=Bifidobacterium bombi DSM 19703 TaxID=1341695 RepID=A0A080N3H6_9BIFI|nr:hypothetical protein [Bifidobacterium bombi]KFF31546.1 hypothetical protein BBOMB_0921 [Bifidobacterium bombi DSM 19703]
MEDDRAQGKVGVGVATGWRGGSIALAHAVLAVLVVVVIMVMRLFLDLRSQIWLCSYLALALWVSSVVFCRPLYGSAADRIVGVLGAGALQFVGLMGLLDALPFFGEGVRTLDFSRSQVTRLSRACGGWAQGLLVVFVVFVAAGFLIQMLRRERKELVVSLSQNVLANAAAASSTGWAFLPVVLWYVCSAPRSGNGIPDYLALIAIVVAVVLTVLLVVVSCRSTVAAAGRRHADVVFAVGLPFMFSGLIVYVLATVLILSLA